MYFLLLQCETSSLDYNNLGLILPTKTVGKISKIRTQILDFRKNLAAVSFLHVAWVWLGRIVLGADGTGLGTGFID